MALLIDKLIFCVRGRVDKKKVLKKKAALDSNLGKKRPIERKSQQMNKLNQKRLRVRRKVG